MVGDQVQCAHTKCETHLRSASETELLVFAYMEQEFQSRVFRSIPGRNSLPTPDSLGQFSQGPVLPNVSVSFLTPAPISAHCDAAAPRPGPWP